MKTRYFISILILFQSILTIAQQPMVAYRKEGIWHYFDTNGKLMWEPYMDVASFPNGWCNGLLKAAAMNITGDKADNIAFERRQVLYDKKGKIVFQPKVSYNYRIVSGGDKLGYFQLKNVENDWLFLCNSKGEVVYESSNATSQYMGDGVVAYLKTDAEMEAEGDKNFILWDIKTKKIISEIKCSGLLGDFRDGAVFCFDTDFKWGMVNRSGKIIQPMIWSSNLLDEDAPFQTGFICLKDPKTEKLSLLNKNGEIVVSDISEVIYLEKGYFQCQKMENKDLLARTYRLEGTKAVELNPNFDNYTQPTEGGIIAYQNEEGDVTLIDKKLKKIANIKGVKDIKIVENHFWIQSDKEGFYDCFNEKGQKKGSIQAEAIGNAAYQHVPFMQGGKWGLAHESGKIVVKPQFEFSTENVPNVENGFWSINLTLSEDNHRFDFYNFDGKLVLSTTAEKDGWDYIIPQETVKYFYRMY